MEDGEGSKKKDSGGGDGGDSREAESIKMEPPDEPNPSVSPARYILLGKSSFSSGLPHIVLLTPRVFDNIFKLIVVKIVKHS
jgi:hypothetical protein